MELLLGQGAFFRGFPRAHAHSRVVLRSELLRSEFRLNCRLQVPPHGGSRLAPGSRL